MLTKSESDVEIKKVIPFLLNAGWNLENEIMTQVTLTDGMISHRGKKVTRSKIKRADIVLYSEVDIPIAVIEVKEMNKPVEAGIQQAIRYAEMLDVPFSFSTNGNEILFRNTLNEDAIELYLSPNDFPSKQELETQLFNKKSINRESLIFQKPHIKKYKPRYYQQVAINRALESISQGLQRMMLVMATGTGKTLTAFQIVWKFINGKPGARVLYLADRNILIDQTLINDFSPLKKISTKISNRKIDKSYQIYFALYQAIVGGEVKNDVYKQFSPEFFDLIIVDECHRGSAKETSNWREILNYFDSAIHLGMTATPKETSEVSNVDYFGKPIYTYSLKNGIADGFLAPYKVVRVNYDKDLYGVDLSNKHLDDKGNILEKTFFESKDIDRTLILEKRTNVVASKIIHELKNIGIESKTIVFCQDQDHALRLRVALVNELSKLGIKDPNYCMRITSDDVEGKGMLEDFINPDKQLPVIATTSKLLSTGVDTKLVKLIVIEQNIQSKSEFKQIIGRGTRVDEERGKVSFTILDFKNATNIFSDQDFDGYPDIILEEDDPAHPDDKTPREKDPQTITKYFFNEIEVSIVAEKVQYLDANGNLISKSITEFSKDNVISLFADLHNFHDAWTEDIKHELIEQKLIENGFLISELEDIFGRNYTLFDLVCHIAYDLPLISRSVRASKVKKYLSKEYQDTLNDSCISILHDLIDRFEVHNENITNKEVLLISDFRKYGSPLEIIKNFNGVEKYQSIVSDLNNNLFEIANEKSN